jgi:hypothetical protein
MKTIKIEAYTIDELSKEAKEKALDWFREMNDDLPYLEEGMEEKLGELLEKNQISGMGQVLYSLSNCQGDGAMFEGDFEWNHYNVNIKQSGHYYHSNSKVITITDEEGNEVTENEPNEAFESIYQSICKELEKYGYQIIEDENSEESVMESIRANDYLFTKDGNRTAVL